MTTRPDARDGSEPGAGKGPGGRTSPGGWRIRRGAGPKAAGGAPRDPATCACPQVPDGRVRPGDMTPCALPTKETAMTERLDTRFHALHQSGLLRLPNAWDAGSARLARSAGA